MQDGTKKVDRVDWVSTKMTSDQADTEWVQLNTSNNIEVGGISVRIATSGYFKALKGGNKEIIGFSNQALENKKGDVYSKTIHPVFNFYVEESLLPRPLVVYDDV